MKLHNTFALYLYCLVMAISWLTLWFADICQWLDGTNCNDTEALTIRMSSFVFLYLASLSFGLVCTNQDNQAFLKHLTYHMMFGLGVILGSIVTFTSSRAEPKWYHFGDVVILLFLFGLLYQSSFNNVAQDEIQQSIWEGHGANPRSFLVILILAIMVKVVSVPDFMPLSSIVDVAESVTARAETFYSLALCEAMALLFCWQSPLITERPKINSMQRLSWW
jgi:hypothetical protein